MRLRSQVTLLAALLATACSSGATSPGGPGGGAGPAGDAASDAGTPADAGGAGDGPGATTDGASAGAVDGAADGTATGPTDGASGAADTSALDATPGQPLYGAQTYAAPKPWGDPIPDYLNAGHEEVGGWAFFRGIHDLAVWQGRLYLGYGDADKNLGRVIPIAVRSYGNPTDLAPTTEFETQEEQIDHYRALGGDLVIPGVDATEDAWLGNVYLRPAGGAWVKRRTVPGGVHVHDVAVHAGALWAVGSGSEPDEWNAGDIYANLWRSTDAGATFEVADRWHNLGEGDARWVWLLPAADSLWVFGYRIDGQGQLADVLNGRLGPDGAPPVEKLPDDHLLRWVYGLHTAVAPDGTGLLVGVNVSEDSLQRRLYRISPSGEVTVASGVGDVSIFDVFPVEETGETLLLARDGAAWGDAPAGAKIRILITADLEAFTELFALPNDPGYESVAAWKGGIYLGTAEGIIEQALPVGP